MNDTPLLHQIQTPEGHEGWQWLNGPIFLYDKDNPIDSADAQLLAMEWAEATMKVQRLQFETECRANRVHNSNPIILSFEDAKAKHENSR